MIEETYQIFADIQQESENLPENLCEPLFEKGEKAAMFNKLFVEHPQSVGESYFEHLGVAFGFGFQMLGAALACMIHGLIPGLFKSTGSQTICCLHDRMVVHRNTKHGPTPIAQSGETALS